MFVKTYGAEDLRRTAKPITQLQQFMEFTLQLNSADEEQIAAVKKKLDEQEFLGETFEDRKERTYDGISIIQIRMNLFAFIALPAASFGIINTLIIAVLERTKEIGLQKALGMNRGKIFTLFSLESVLIGFWARFSALFPA